MGPQQHVEPDPLALGRAVAEPPAGGEPTPDDDPGANARPEPGRYSRLRNRTGPAGWAALRSAEMIADPFILMAWAGALGPSPGALDVEARTPERLARKLHFPDGSE
jgi:hypothetical protein